MALRDPVAVYNAANNIECVFIRDMLLAEGIEAHIVEDVSQVGLWAFGTLPEIHKPQVWTERSDVERVKPVLEAYERQAAARRNPVIDANPFIAVICEECEKRSEFPASRRGAVEVCPHCGAYVDVGEGDELEGWDATDVDEEV